jgi:uncharacterized repeat protein (TIGR01451 family)
MRGKGKSVLALKKANTIVLVSMLILGAFVLAVTPPGEEPAEIEDWPLEGEWINYTFRGERILDWEDKPYENDPTHGIANVQPDAVDIASGVDASGGNPESNPGDYTSVQYVYKDTNGDSEGFENLDDDWLFLRMRIAGDPKATGGKYMYKSYHWDILLEVDGDLWSEFVVDLNGGNGFFKWGTVGVYYNNTEDYEYDPDNDGVWLQEASKEQNTFTRVVDIDYGTPSEDDDQWWIEYRIPVIAFTDLANNQLLGPDSGFLLFFSTSASMTNPLQKDWMGEYVFGEPANITVEKTVEEGTVYPGDTLHYKIYYNNTGDFNANHVWVNETIPEYTTFIESSPNYDSEAEGTYRWHFTDVEPGNHTIYVNVSVDSDVPDDTILTNVVLLNYTDHNDNEQPGSEDETENPVSVPIMTLTKVADSDTADPGDIIEYTISYDNLGSGGAYNVMISDTIPEHTSYYDSDPDYDSVDGNTYTWNFDYVPGYSTNEILLYVTVDPYTADETILENYVTLDYEDVNENEYPQLEDWEYVTVSSPFMTISKTVDAEEANPGDEITYTISYENTGTGDAYNVVIVDTIDPDTTYVSATPAPDDITGDVITWNLGTVAGETSGTITLIVEVDAYVGDGTVLTNSVILNYEDPNDNPYDEEEDSVEVTVTAPLMTVYKTADVEDADPGDEITYTISYENTGTGDAFNVVIVDTIDPDTTYVSANPAPNDITGDVITWNLGTVAGETSGTITLIVEVDAYVGDGAVLTNGVTLNYEDPNDNPYDEEEDSVDVTVTAPLMTISKTVDAEEANPGDEITYTISYENTGTGDAYNVVIVDTIDQDTTYVSANPAPDDITGDVLTWNLGTVVGGASDTITLIVEVDAYVGDGAVLTNVVTLNYEDPNDNPYDEEEDSVDVTVTAPTMTISKTADVDEANPGDEITYTISYENTGTGDAHDVTIVDTIDPDTTYVSATPAPDDVTGDVITWNLGTVAGGASGTITLIVEVDAYVGDGAILTNTVTLNYNDPSGNPYDEEEDSVFVTVTAPTMTISKTVNVDEADPGDEVIYTISYENTGTGDATDVVIVDTIDPDTTYVSATPAPDDITGDVLTWNFGTVAGGGSGTILLTVEVDAYVTDGAVLTNDVTLNYDDANGNPYTEESDSVDFTVTAPDMTFSKTANVNNADPSDTIIYTLTYENTGSGVATDVVVTDTIPVGVSYSSSSPPYSSESGGTYTWNIGAVAGFGGGSITLTVTVDVGVADGTLLHNTATLDYDDANGNPYTQLTDYADVTVTAPKMTFTKSADVEDADPGDTIVYTLYYENEGSGQATDVVVTDTISDDTTYVSSNPGYDSQSGNTYTWNVGSVAGYGSGSITLTVTVNVGVDDGTVLTNTATLDHDDANGNPYPQLDDEAEVTVTAPVMTFSKVADVTSADPGDTIVYTISYNNDGSGIATDVVVIDTIDEDTTFVSSDPTYDSESGDTYTFNIGTVDAYSGGTVTITVTVDAGVSDGALLRNSATMDYDDANDNPYPQMSDYADVYVTAPVLGITKTADVADADPGDEITYTIEFSNTGSGNATDVWINDTIPEHTTFLSSTPTYDSESGDTYTWFYALVEDGASVVITIVVEVDVGTADHTLLHNEVTLDYSDDNGNPLPQETASADVSVTAPVLHITKTAYVTEADPGDSIIYTLEYWNSGSGAATLVEIVDTIPAYTTMEGTDPVYDSESGDVYTWEIGDVAAGGSGTITITVTVDVATPDETLLHNVATLDYADANGNYYTQLDDYADITVTAPIMSIKKTASVSTANPGDTILYTIEYENTGTGWASLVEIVDTIPVHTTFDSSIPPYDVESGYEYTWNVGDVAPESTDFIMIAVTVDAGTPDTTLLHNEVTLDYADTNGNFYPQRSDYADVVVTAPVMSLSKTADVADADPGDTIVYTISYENTGTGDASNVVIVDTLPSDVTYVTSSVTPSSVVGNVVTWDVGDVGSGAGDSLTVTVTVNAGTADETSLLNEVTLDYSDVNGNHIEQLYDSETVVVTAPVMTLSKEVGEITISQYVLADFTIRIAGEKWHDVRLTLLHEDGATQVASVTRFPGDPDKQSVTIYDVKVGIIPGSFTAVIEYTPLDDAINGQIWGADPCWIIITFPDSSSVRLHHTFNVRHNDTWIWVIDDFLPYIAGQPVITEATIPYLINYENIGTGDASNVQITDSFPENLTIEDSDPLYDSVSGSDYTWNIGTVLAGEGGQILITAVYVLEEDELEVTNEVTMGYSDANGNFIEELYDAVDVVVTVPVHPSPPSPIIPPAPRAPASAPEPETPLNGEHEGKAEFLPKPELLEIYPSEFSPENPISELPTIPTEIEKETHMAETEIIVDPVQLEIVRVHEIRIVMGEPEIVLPAESETEASGLEKTQLEVLHPQELVVSGNFQASEAVVAQTAEAASVSLYMILAALLAVLCALLIGRFSTHKKH